MDRRTETRGDAASAAPETGVENARTGVWLLLATLFRAAPDGALLEQLQNGIEATDADDPLASAWQALHHATCGADPEAIDAEFHQLFIGLGRGELVPYASWYRTGFLMDRPLVALRSELGALGLRRCSDNREPEDHAASLAETMALLTDPEYGTDTAAQARFFREHVDSWMPSLFQDLQQARTAEFYRAVGALGAAFIDFERRLLEEAAAA